MTDLFDFAALYPNAPGFKRTETSRAAADDMAGKAAGLRALVLAALGECPDGLTTEEIVRRVGVGYASIQPRTSELRALGWIRDSGIRRSNASGKLAIVWRRA